MTNDEIFLNIFNGGRFSLPWLIKFSCDELSPIYLVNNNENIIYDENTYLASSFEYTEPDINGAGASLNISGIDNSLIPFIENADDSMRLDIVGVMAKDGSIQPIKQYIHLFGSVSYSEDLQLKFSLGRDDRLDMTFPPYKFDSDINRGNA